MILWQCSHPFKISLSMCKDAFYVHQTTISLEIWICSGRVDGDFQMCHTDRLNLIIHIQWNTSFFYYEFVSRPISLKIVTMTQDGKAEHVLYYKFPRPPDTVDWITMFSVKILKSLVIFEKCTRSKEFEEEWYQVICNWSYWMAILWFLLLHCVVCVQWIALDALCRTLLCVVTIEGKREMKLKPRSHKKHMILVYRLDMGRNIYSPGKSI